MEKRSGLMINKEYVVGYLVDIRRKMDLLQLMQRRVR
tara:strand:+ start:155 stop:265 length:111 start_codon:yes stop_codon:yes gene_type:complete